MPTCMDLSGVSSLIIHKSLWFKQHTKESKYVMQSQYKFPHSILALNQIRFDALQKPDAADKNSSVNNEDPAVVIYLKLQLSFDRLRNWYKTIGRKLYLRQWTLMNYLDIIPGLLPGLRCSHSSSNDQFNKSKAHNVPPQALVLGIQALCAVNVLFRWNIDVVILDIFLSP